MGSGVGVATVQLDRKLSGCIDCANGGEAEWV